VLSLAEGVEQRNANDGGPRFSRAMPVDEDQQEAKADDYTYAGYTAEQKAAAKKVFGSQTKPTFKQRAKEWKANLASSCARGWWTSSRPSRRLTRLPTSRRACPRAAMAR
jgi:hypothetical protein